MTKETTENTQVNRDKTIHYWFLNGSLKKSRKKI